ncbi:MAG TPA: dTMP kinase [Candidatus Saccharicenans sp.]|nr:dTMP kinase [Candidatus Saccharicenans sp.]HPU94046.1 dTMP kinase [Candidatus Saccharicenans sp.]
MEKEQKKQLTLKKPSPARGLFIVFEGIDGCGKSTQVELLADKLRRRGKQVVTLSEPTAGRWGQKIRDSARTKGSLSPAEELELFIRDRKEDIKNNIKPALEAGQIVILDRYFYSTLAYQGARGLDMNEIRAKHDKFVIRPDIVFILDVPVSQALKRIAGRPVIYSLFEDYDYLQKVRKNFLKLKDSECYLLDGRQPPEDISRQVWQILTRRFPWLKVR